MNIFKKILTLALILLLSSCALFSDVYDLETFDKKAQKSIENSGEKIEVKPVK